jgi:hypothetical protein
MWKLESHPFSTLFDLYPAYKTKKMSFSPYPLCTKAVTIKERRIELLEMKGKNATLFCCRMVWVHPCSHAPTPCKRLQANIYLPSTEKRKNKREGRGSHCRCISCGAGWGKTERRRQQKGVGFFHYYIPSTLLTDKGLRNKMGTHGSRRGWWVCWRASRCPSSSTSGRRSWWRTPALRPSGERTGSSRMSVLRSSLHPRCTHVCDTRHSAIPLSKIFTYKETMTFSSSSFELLN